MSKFFTKDKRKLGHCPVRGCGKWLFSNKEDRRWGLLGSVLLDPRIGTLLRGKKTIYLCASHLGEDGRFRKG